METKVKSKEAETKEIRDQKSAKQEKKATAKVVDRYRRKPLL